MNYKDIQEEYIIIKAYTQSETESCDYVLIKEGLAFIENLRKRAKGIELLKEKELTLQKYLLEKIMMILFSIKKI